MKDSNLIAGNKGLIILLILAFLLRLVWIIIFPSLDLEADFFSDAKDYDQTALGLVKGQGYHNQGFHAYRPPGYPFFLAAIYKIFGHNYFAVKITQVALGTTSILLLFLIILRLLGQKVAIISALFFSFYPEFLRYPTELLSETLFIFLILLSLFLAIRSIDSNSMVFPLFSGGCLGLSILTREIGFALLPVVFLLIVKRQSAAPETGRRLRKAFLIFIATAIVVLPWTIRNYLIFHQPIVVSTNGGINFYIGNNLSATGTYNFKIPPVDNPSEQQSSDNSNGNFLYELQLNSNGYREGFKFIKQHPEFFLRGLIKKAKLFWMPPLHQIDFNQNTLRSLYRVLWATSYTFLLVSAVLGLVYLIMIRATIWQPILLWILLVMGVHLLTYLDSRYRLPVMPFMIFFSSAAVARWLPLRKKEA
jgi:4-amino-4-deoxy-L-arabinose transferase-like glycosyltransferase